jgi:hypothetical protein
MSKSNRLVAVGLAALFALSSAGVAQAYPSGSNPTIGLSSYSRLAPGDQITVSVSRIYKGCDVTLGWDGATSVSAVAGKTGRILPQTFASPAIGGQHTLNATLGDNCNIDAGRTITKTITIGRLVRHAVAIKTSTSSARRNPTLTLTGKIFWGSEAQVGVNVSLELTTPDGSTVLSATTDANGVYTATYGGKGQVSPGQYTVVATVAPDATYAGSIKTSRTVNIRK